MSSANSVNKIVGNIAGHGKSVDGVLGNILYKKKGKKEKEEKYDKD